MLKKCLAKGWGDEVNLPKMPKEKNGIRDFKPIQVELRLGGSFWTARGRDL